MVKTDFETFTFSYCSRVKRKASIKYLGTNSITGGRYNDICSKILSNYCYDSSRQCDGEDLCFSVK